METAQQRAASEVLKRREIQESLVAWGTFWASQLGYKLASHQTFMLEKLQGAIDGTLKHSKTGEPVRCLLISMPPGASKSKYSSVVFPTWAIQRLKKRMPDPRVLACSHTTDLIRSFSYECRSLVERHGKLLGYGLKEDSRSVDEWSLDNGASYFCFGVGSRFAGRRADLGLIDDYIGAQEDADSELMRTKIWSWYVSDFWSRLKPGAIQVIIATRWCEDDLIGRLTDPDNKYNSPESPESWEVIKFPFFAEEDDCLGRPTADMTSVKDIDFMRTGDKELRSNPAVQAILSTRLWPTWYTEAQALGVLRLTPKARAGLWQQRPRPEDGDYFKKDWLLGYTLEDYQRLIKLHPRVIGAGDWAVSTGKGANKTCLGGAFQDEEGILYILPDIFWKKAEPKEVVDNYISWIQRWNPYIFRSEKGHISKAWGPFLRELMLQRDVFAYIDEVTPARSKGDRAQSIRNRMAMLTVRFPKWCAWWEQAEAELLAFTGSGEDKSDDFCDFLAHIGLYLGTMMKMPKREAPVEEKMGSKPITLSWVKRSHNQQLAQSAPRYGGR